MLLALSVLLFAVTGLVTTSGRSVAHAADTWWQSGALNIYTIYPYWEQYTSKYPNTTLTSVTNQLDTYKAQGFNAILFQPINAGVGSTLPGFGGLAQLELKDIAPSFGTLAQYQHLVDEAHSRGMKVLLFHNLGYASTQAAFFTKACDDFRNDRNTPERNWFVFQTSPTPLSGGWSWQPCGQGGNHAAYYATFWERQPAFDWNSQTWLNKVKEIVNFWMGFGTDGMSFDAPQTHWGVDRPKFNQYVTDVMNAYGAPAGYYEGVGAKDLTWVRDYHLQGLEDYQVAAQYVRPTEITKAILDHNATGLEGALNAFRDRVTSTGGMLWSHPSWTNGADPVLSPAQRALENATISSMGAVNDWHDTQQQNVLDFWTSWTPAEREKVFAVLRASRDNPALGTSGERLKLATTPAADSAKNYAFKRTSKDGTKAALVVLNFDQTPRTITVDLAGSGIGPQVPTDLINGGNADAITSSTYTVSLPAYGYTFLGLPQSQGAGGSLQGSSIHNPTGTSTNLSSEGTDDWAHWGLSAATSFTHRSGPSSQISNYTKLGTGPIDRFADNLVTYSWTGGTPTASATNTRTGVFARGSGTGFRITVPADTTARRLKLYVGAWQAYAKVRAYLTDGSALPYTDFFESSQVSTSKVYALDFRAGKPNQTLVVDVAVDTAHDEVNGNVTLQAATLSTPAAGLTGSSVNTVSDTNLSTEGVDDWAHWGASGGFDHKSGVTPKISDYTVIGTGTPAVFSNNSARYSWSGGTPTASVSNTPTGVFVAGNGNGFRLTVPADATQKTVKLHAGAWQARAKVTATLSDGSAPPFTELFDSSEVTTNRTFALSYKAASAGQTLTLEVTVDTSHAANGNVTLQAATLATSASGGVLTGGSARIPLATNLSNQSTDDWAHWGLGGAGAFTHKSGVTPKISTFTRLGPNAPLGFTNNNVTYTWAGGTPTASAVATQHGIYVVGNGNGFRVTVPADATLRTFKLYVGCYQSLCRVQSRLSDGSSPEYVDYFDSSTVATSKVYTFDHRAASAGKSLVVDVVVDTQHGDPFGNVTLQAATLST